MCCSNHVRRPSCRCRCARAQRRRWRSVSVQPQPQYIPATRFRSREYSTFFGRDLMTRDAYDRVTIFSSADASVMNPIHVCLIALEKTSKKYCFFVVQVSSENCVICLDNAVSVMCMPCGHLCLCNLPYCLHDIQGKPCPICRTMVETTQEIS